MKKYLIITLLLLNISVKSQTFISHNFIQPKNTIPFIKAKINNKWAYFLLDTGAGSSILDVGQVRNYKLDFSKIEDGEFSGIGGSKEYYRVLGVNNLIMDDEEYFLRFNAVDLNALVKDIYDIYGVDILGVIGSDFLSKYEFNLDFSNNKIVRKI
jgi:hypothetical protein